MELKDSFKIFSNLRMLHLFSHAKILNKISNLAQLVSLLFQVIIVCGTLFIEILMIFVI